MVMESVNPGAKPAPPEDDVVLAVEGVSKKFCRSLKRSLLYGLQDMGGELLGQTGQRHPLRRGEFWALQDVSFELRRGEALGLVGANGAGKTTLLRIIGGLIRPDRGRVVVKGWVAPLIALGAGFNPVLTGRENIYANMAILGLSQDDIDARFADVVAFSEIGDAIDAPVHSYSSGMTARLGFSSAVFTEPDILLIDEVLSVGDIQFKSKCFRRLHKLRQNGTSFILVSHSSAAILNKTERAIYINKGRQINTGISSEIIKQYEEDIAEASEPDMMLKQSLPNDSEQSSTGMAISRIYLQDKSGREMSALKTGECAKICVEILAHNNFDDVALHFSITQPNREEENILYLSNFYDSTLFSVQPGQQTIVLSMPQVMLRQGQYYGRFFLRKAGTFTYDSVDRVPLKVISDVLMTRCAFYQPRTWSIKQE